LPDCPAPARDLHRSEPFVKVIRRCGASKGETHRTVTRLQWSIALHGSEYFKCMNASFLWSTQTPRQFFSPVFSTQAATARIAPTEISMMAYRPKGAASSFYELFDTTAAFAAATR
jgi:hypothetical protein